MIVELDIFSGRPNPRWELDDRARRALQGLEAGLKPAAATAREAPPPLGYRGFVYGEDGDLRRAYLGRIERAGALLDDPDRTIERLLVDSIPAELAPVRAKVAPLVEPDAA